MSNNIINLATARELIKRYRDNLTLIATPEFKDSLKYSETFDASAIQAILNQPGCVEFRAYYGMKENNAICSIFVGVDAEDNDILNSLSGNGEDVIVEYGKECPPRCSTSTNNIY
jgi:hypothetical protein